jgi:hypothetical protein
MLTARCIRTELLVVSVVNEKGGLTPGPGVFRPVSDVSPITLIHFFVSFNDKQNVIYLNSTIRSQDHTSKISLVDAKTRIAALFWFQSSKVSSFRLQIGFFIETPQLGQRVHSIFTSAVRWSMQTRLHSCQAMM